MAIRWSPYIVRAAQRLSSRTCMVSVEDLIQVGHIGLLEAIRKFDKCDGRFATWAPRWIKSRMVDLIRSASWFPRSQRWRETAMVEHEEYMTAASDDVERQVAALESYEHLERSIGRLPPRRRQVLQYHLAKRRQQDCDLAAAMGLSTGSFGSMLKVSRQHLVRVAS